MLFGRHIQYDWPIFFLEGGGGGGGGEVSVGRQ